jgi:acyl dehydratase
MTLAMLGEMVGREVAVTEWFAIRQERIDKFADATEDWQWIHLDRPRAQRESPYGATVAHGFLTLSMLSHLSRNILPVEGVRLRVNYGLNRVRFPAPVREGWRIRGRFTLLSVKDFTEGVDVTLDVRVEVDGGEKPCCVAEWIVRYYAS